VVLPVTLVKSEILDGVTQIQNLASQGYINVVIFLREPIKAKFYDPDIYNLLQVYNIYNVPIATNMLSAETILELLFQSQRILRRYYLAIQYLDDVVAIHN